MSEDHFAHVAQDYDRLRTGAGAWQEIAEVALDRLGQPRRLIDVGCGTGRFASLAADRLGARVWGVDTNEAMLEQAKTHAGGKLAFRRAAAERLPFKEGWFDAGHMHLVLHLLADPAAALTELARVLGAGARLVIVTFDPDHFRRFYLNPYFPSIEAIDAERFALPQTTEAQLEAAGFEPVTLERIERSFTVPAADVLERVRGRYISTLSLIPADEYATGLERLEADIAAGRESFDQHLVWMLLAARHR